MPAETIEMTPGDPGTASERSSGVAVLDRAFAILNAFGPTDDRLTLAELSRRTDLYKSTVLRLLGALEHGGFVRKLNDGQYAIGPQPLRLAALYQRSFQVGSRHRAAASAVESGLGRDRVAIRAAGRQTTGTLPRRARAGRAGLDSDRGGISGRQGGVGQGAACLHGQSGPPLERCSRTAMVGFAWRAGSGNGIGFGAGVRGDR